MLNKLIMMFSSWHKVCHVIKGDIKTFVTCQDDSDFNLKDPRVPRQWSHA